jgi:Protein of unknown function (DUF3153)
MRFMFKNFQPALQVPFKRLTDRLIPLMGLLLCCFFLTGCVDYQLGIHFDSPNNGQFTQRIRLDNYTNPTAQAFLQQVRQQTRSVQGSVQSISNAESLVTVPFHTAQELEQKFNQFFQPDNQTRNQTASDLPAIVSNLKIAQSNWLLFEHDQLTFDLDLTALGLQGTEAFADPGGLFNLKMAVNDRTWDLKPGKKNQVVTDFWLPMPLGWGTVAIGVLVSIGLQLRKRRVAP